MWQPPSPTRGPGSHPSPTHAHNIHATRMGKGSKEPAHPGVKALNEASTLQQRGERRAGQDAIQCFEKAAASFREALAAGLPNAEQQQEAVMGLGETLQQAAGGIMEYAQSLPDDQLSWVVEDQARTQAATLYSQSVEVYLQARTGGSLAPDAAVNCANTLCSWAETLAEAHDPSVGAQLAQQATAAVQAMTGTLGVTPWSRQQPPPTDNTQAGVQGSAPAGDPSPQQQAACALLDCACGLYLMALAQEEDALTHSNLGDALMTWAQSLWTSGQHQQAQAVTQAALTAYATSCSMSNSDDGDDLPGLLCNWGLGLVGAGQQVPDPAAKRELLSQAEVRLRSAAEFIRADPAPLIGLGDALVAQAEVLTGVTQGNGSQQPQPTPEEAVVEAVAKLRAALEEGYGGALRIQRGHPEALVGCAEAHSALARLAYRAGDNQASLQHWQEAVNHYQAALRVPEKIPGFGTRCETRYNLVCCLAMCGEEAAAAELLSQLLMCQGVTLEDVRQDTDLAGRPWVQQLTQLPPADGAVTQ